MRCSRRYLALWPTCLRAAVALIVLSAGCRGRQSPRVDAGLAGDWDYYLTLGAAANGGFEARRRMGVAHFDGPSADGAWLKRRSGASLNPITKVNLTGDDVGISLGDTQEIRGVMKGDTISGQIYRGGKPIDRVWLVKRSGPPMWEPNYDLWPGAVSQPTFQVTIDPAVPMTARDGTVLMNYIARPLGDGPFGVVLERTPYLRTDKANGEFWASRGYIYVKQDVRGRGGSGERRLDRVKVPVLGIAGWHDDARGTIRNYTVMSRLPGAPVHHVVMDPGAHKGVDYVNGDFGPLARIDHRALQLRWFDHYLKGIDNGVDAQAALDLFVIGDNTWRKEREWPLASTVWTDFHLRQNGGLDTVAPGNEPPDEYTYDPANPTPYLVDARELELSLNEDYRTVHAERKDMVTYTTAPLAKDTEITGPMTATLWAVTDAKDTDWNLMILHVYQDGRAERIQDGIMRARFRDGFDKPSLLEPGKTYKYDIDLWFTSRVIPAGHQLRVTVASAGFPKYDRNLNTGGDNERDTKHVVARQRILHDAAHRSLVRLPIIQR
jgi:predicted acyl esterase